MENCGRFVVFNNIFFYENNRHCVTCYVIFMVYLNNRPHFLWVYRRDNPSGMLGEHRENLVNQNIKYKITKFSMSLLAQ